MTFEFTADGLEIDTFDELYTRLADGLREIYGDDINLDQNAPDGVRLGIIVKELLDTQEFAQLLYSQLDIDFSFGTFQDVMLKITGIAKRPATRSQVDVTVTTDRNLTLETGYTAKDVLEQTWITEDDNALTTGANTVSFVSEAWGEIEADVDTITIPVTVVQGVTALTNPLAATAGNTEETENEVRVRRNQSLENPSYSLIGSMVSKLGQVSGVTDVVGYENVTNVTDSRGIPPHSVWCIVENGAVADIVESMTKQKTGGTGTYGSTSGQWVETVLRPNGEELTITHTMNFGRPTDVPLYINVTATRKDSGVPVDIDLLKEELAKKTFVISEDAEAAKFYAYGYNAGDTFVLTDLEISDDDITFVDGELASALDGKFSIDVANIDVTEVV